MLTILLLGTCCGSAAENEGGVDVKAILEAGGLDDGAPAEISGWLVDAATGLVILADHFPEDFDYPIRIEVANSNIMYAIRRIVPALAGGSSSLFYRCKAGGRILRCGRVTIDVETLQVETRRGSSVYDDIPLNAELVKACTDQWGDFAFDNLRCAGDWMGNA